MPEFLEETIEKVRHAWMEKTAAPMLENAGSYVVGTAADYCIVCVWNETQEDYYKVGYLVTESGLEFDDRLDWTPVEKKIEWVEMVKHFKARLSQQWMAIGEPGMKAWKSEDGLFGYVEALGARFFDGAHLDTDRQYFDAETDFGPHLGNGVDATLNHRIPIKTKSQAANQTLKQLARLKFTHPVKTEKTDLGLVARHVLDLANEYERLVFDLAQKGAFRWSPGSAPHMVSFQKSGNAQRIESWPIIEWAYTPTPADHNLPPIVPLKTLKEFTLAEDLFPVAENAGDALAPSNLTIHAEAVNIYQTEPSSVASHPKDTKMDEEEKTPPTFSAEQVEDIAFKAASKAADLAVEKALKNFGERQSGKVINDPGVALPKYNKKTGLGDSEEKAMANFMRYGDYGGVRHMIKGVVEDEDAEGIDRRLLGSPMLSIKASNATIMNITTNADGKYAVPVGHVPRIIARRDEAMLRNSLGLQQVPGKGTTVNYPFDNEADGEFVSTTEQVDAYTNTFDVDSPAIGQKAFTLVKYSKDVPLTDELLEDEDSNMLAFIENFIGRGMAKTHNSLLITEVAANGTNLVTFSTASTIGTGKLETMEGNDDLGAYLDDSGSVAWVMRNSTLAAIRKITESDVRPYSVGGSGGPGVNAGRTLLEYPVYRTNQASAIAASAKTVYFGNWNYVGFRDGPDIQILRNPYKHQGLVHLEYYFRTVYGVLIAEAIGYGVHPTNTA